MSEKRLYHRMNIEIPVCFEIKGSKKLITASTLDISATGLSFKMNEPIEIDETIRISLGTEENKIVKVDAKVVWVKGRKSPNGMAEYWVGVRIVDKMDQDEIEFVRFVARKMMEHFKREEEWLGPESARDL